MSNKDKEPLKYVPFSIPTERHDTFGEKCSRFVIKVVATIFMIVLFAAIGAPIAIGLRAGIEYFGEAMDRGRITNRLIARCEAKALNSYDPYEESKKCKEKYAQ